MLARSVSAAAQLQNLDYADLALGHLLDIELDDRVGNRKLRFHLRVLSRVRRVPDRRCRGGREAPNKSVQKLPESGDVSSHRVEGPEAVEDDDPGPRLPQVTVDRMQDLIKPALT